MMMMMMTLSLLFIPYWRSLEKKNPDSSIIIPAVCDVRRIMRGIIQSINWKNRLVCFFTHLKVFLSHLHWCSLLAVALQLMDFWTVSIEKYYVGGNCQVIWLFPSLWASHVEAITWHCNSEHIYFWKYPE